MMEISFIYAVKDVGVSLTSQLSTRYFHCGHKERVKYAPIQLGVGWGKLVVHVLPWFIVCTVVESPQNNISIDWFL